MTDDELDRLLRAARPETAADSGWAGSEDGERALAAIHAATTAPGNPAVRLLRRARPFSLGIALTAAAAAIVAVGLAMPGPSSHQTRLGAPPPTDAAPPPLGATPVHMSLVGYDSCTAMRDALRRHTAAAVTAHGLTDSGSVLYGAAEQQVRGPVPAAAIATAAGAAGVPDHSTTNDQEKDADEPDIVKNDGRRVVSVSGGVLRVVDAATRQLTGSLDLRIYAGMDGAQLLLAGDRVLVIGGQSGYRYGPAVDALYPNSGGGSGSAFLLVDIAGPPTVVSTLHADGGFVDARLIDGTVRAVVASAPRLTFPVPTGNPTARERRAANRAAVRAAPLSAWLPRYETGAGGATVEHTVACDRVNHPVKYTGESMLTVYSFDPAATLDNPHPVSVAADGATVYATAANLYVASTDGRNTDLHRFYVGAKGAPRYVGSGRVPGWLLDSYSMSEYDGALRVVTTSGQSRSVSSLYVLDADTLRREGSVGGLGVGENLHAVRFLGPLAYVVTFESVDPLYVIDLHDPAHPVKAGELTVPGYSDYLHPTDPGRLLGVGQSVDDEQRVTGLQVSLFDVSQASRPARLDVITRQHTPSETPIDPHAFLYWPATRIAVIPIDSWEPSQSGAALVVHVGRNELQVVGTIRNPAVNGAGAYDTGIERTLIIGDTVWTMSSAGLQVSDQQSLVRRAWIPFT